MHDLQSSGQQTCIYMVISGLHLCYIRALDTHFYLINTTYFTWGTKQNCMLSNSWVCYHYRTTQLIFFFFLKWWIGHSCTMVIWHQIYLFVLVLIAQNMPRLETVENCMRVSQMMVQGLWDNKSPLLQLPHLNQENLRHFTTKKVQYNYRKIHVQHRTAETCLKPFPPWWQ